MLQRGSILLTVLAILLALPTAVSAAGPLSVEADRLEFSTDGQLIKADGHAVLVYEDITLRAASLVCQDTIVKASGDVVLITSTGELHADRLELNLETRAIAAEKIRGQIGQFFIRAETLEPLASAGQALLGAGFTRCKLPTPCYELQAGRITIAGKKVTIERGWLALKGHRVLPLPRLTLNLDRVEAWPALSGGYDRRGLYLGAEFAIPLGEGDKLDLVVAGELATIDALTIRPSLAWRPQAGKIVEPWLEYSTSGRSQAGLDLSTALGRSSAGSGAWSLAAFWSQAAGGPEPELRETGATLRWLNRVSPGNETELGLSLGRSWTAGTSDPLLRLRAAATRRTGSSWGLDLQFTYETLARDWETGSLGVTRYFDCYYLRLGYDWTEGALGVSGGLQF